MEQKPLSEADIEQLLQELERGWAPTTTTFTVEVVTHPYVTFDDDTMLALVDALEQTPGICDPIAILDCQNGEISAAFQTDTLDALDAIRLGDTAFRAACQSVGVLVEALAGVHAYVTPEIEFDPDEYEEGEEEGGY